jgi:ketosteroid isomerase-like protein
MNMLEPRQGGEDLSEQQNRETLERLLRAFVQQNFDALEDLLHEDVVEQYPRSGERIRGLQNYQSYVENIPKIPNVIDYSIKVSGDPTIAERTVEYDGNRMYNTVVCEMQDGKIKSLHSVLLHHSKCRGGGRGGSKDVTARKPTCGGTSVTPGLRIESKRKRSPCPGRRERKANA